MKDKVAWKTVPGGNPIVYVKGVRAEDLPAEMNIPKGIDRLYAIHGENGEPIALVGDRRVAFTVARQNSMAPVSVH
ncbi:MAG: DUF1150 family protein [Alphaproteobacteria bacterium]|nr:MAG: DUF1150 family protein [Alphaproteobacteria bacterium]